MASSPEKPSLGRETLILLAGRGANLALSMVGLVVYPILLGPKAHGTLQYYLGSFMFLLGLLNGCAAPMLSHFIAIYRVSDPGRQWPFIRQVFRWFFVMLLSIWLVYPFLADRTGFAWIFFGVAVSGTAQLLSSAEYGLGFLGPTTWFPVLVLFMRVVLIGGYAGMMAATSGPSTIDAWAVEWIPILLLVASLPSLAWMILSFRSRSHTWFDKKVSALAPCESWFPWHEIKLLGIASLLGQLIYQIFTRTLVPLAGQMEFPREQVGYLGLSIQGFALVIYLASIFSVSAYPWLVSSAEAGEKERFSEIQAESWRMSAFLGGWLVAMILGMTRPLIWVVLGEGYHRDINLMTRLIQIGGIAGGLMLAAEFHLRMLLSLTRMKQYLVALAVGFAFVIPYAAWVIGWGKGIVLFTCILPLGVGGLLIVSHILAPLTPGFFRTSLCAVGCIGFALLAGLPANGSSMAGFGLKGLLLTLGYGGLAWLTGLFRKQDLLRVIPARRIQSSLYSIFNRPGR
ncbi:MAG: hypothetical protein AMXMBFR75_17330 [Candidatus Hinthialibacteria bacterium]